MILSIHMQNKNCGQQRVPGSRWRGQGEGGVGAGRLEV